MKYILSGVVLALSLVPVSFADMITAAAPAACSSGSLKDYIALGNDGCLIGDKKFFNFNYNALGTAKDAKFIAVTPSSQPFAASLTFDAVWLNGTKSGIGFSIEVQPGGNPMIGAGLGAKADIGLVGLGMSDVREGLCLGTFAPTCDADKTLKAHLDKDKSLDADAAAFAAITKSRVSLAYVVNSFDGAADLSRIVTTFAEQTPEPSAFTLIGTGLIGLGLIARRRAARH